jgi:hypothetical protein
MKALLRNKKFYIPVIIILAVVAGGVALYMSRDAKPKQTPVVITPVAVQPAAPGAYTITKPNIICTLSMPPTCTGDITVKTVNLEGVKILVDNNTKVHHKDRDAQLYLDALKEGTQIDLTMRPNSSTADTVTILN